MGSINFDDIVNAISDSVKAIERDMNESFSSNGGDMPNSSIDSRSFNDLSMGVEDFAENEVNELSREVMEDERMRIINDVLSGMSPVTGEPFRDYKESYKKYKREYLRLSDSPVNLTVTEGINALVIESDGRGGSELYFTGTTYRGVDRNFVMNVQNRTRPIFRDDTGEIPDWVRQIADQVASRVGSTIAKYLND